MPRTLVLFALLLLSLTVASSPQAAEPEAKERPRYKSPLGLAVDAKGERAYVALHTGDALAVVDLKAGKVSRELAVGRGPYDVALAKESIYVTCELDDTLAMIDLKSGVVLRRTRVGQAPRRISLAWTNENEPQIASFHLYFLCRDDSSLWWKDSETGTLESIALPQWPIAIEAGYAWPHVICAGSGKEVLARVYVERREVKSDLRFHGASNVRGLTHRLVVNQRPKTHIPSSQIVQGWVFTNNVTLHDGGYAERASVALDEVNHANADPSDVLTKADPKQLQLFVSCAGANCVLVLDRKKLVERAYATADDNWGYDWADEKKPIYSEDLTASRQFVIARIPTQANPRRLALSGDGKTLVVSNYLADSLTVIDAVNPKVVKHIPLGGPKPDAARRGEILFNSGKMTFHGQFTCASCHPNGEADGLNWDLERDGIGNFKNTKSLLGVKDTAPYGWEGSSPTLADRVRGTLRTLHRHEPTGTEVEDIVAYLESLRPPRPLPVKEADKPAVARGKPIFAGKGKCIDCHHRVAFDDGKSHNVGTRGPGDTTDRFDTPSLRGVARTAPYLHDGRAATLEEVFTKHNPKRLHGDAHILSKDELADLIAYLKSL